MRFAPTLDAGTVGWATEDTGAGGTGKAGGCCLLLTHTARVELWSETFGSHGWVTATVLTVPGVASVSLDGAKPTVTHSDGLPFGLRVAVLRVPEQHRGGGPVAFNASGQRIPMRASPRPVEGGPSRRSHGAPRRPPPGACELRSPNLRA